VTLEALSRRDAAEWLGRGANHGWTKLRRPAEEGSPGKVVLSRREGQTRERAFHFHKRSFAK